MARPRSDPRSDTRGRILKAAIDEFASHGYDAAGVDRIARRARVNKALIYYYFDNKRGLYHEILHASLQALVAPLRLVVDGPGDADAKLATLHRHARRAPRPAPASAADHAARAGRRRPAPRRRDVASDAHAAAATVPPGGPGARRRRLWAVRPADAALRAHGHGHAHGEQRPNPPPRPPAGPGAASTRHGRDYGAVADRRPPYPSQGPHRCFDSRIESLCIRLGVGGLALLALPRPPQVAANRTRPPIASASPAMSKPTTCS